MSWFMKESPLVQKYKKHRDAGESINHQALETCLDARVFEKATRLLGIRKGKTILLDNEDELPAVMDFALHDCRQDGKNAFERYQTEVGGKTKIEKELLARMLHAYTSLFRIESIRQAENTLILSDLLTEQEPIRLIDISLSQTAAPDYLLFLRLIPLDDFTMSAGFGFVFSPGKEKFLLRQQKILMRKVQSEDTAVQRFVAFFKLNQRIGLGMGYT